MMPLTESPFIDLQIQLHRLALSKNMGVSLSSFPKGRVLALAFFALLTNIPPQGLFPPENAFAPRMIPELLKAGIEWVLVDNIHFDRAHVDYPWTSGSNLYPPNPAGANYPSLF